METIQLQLPFSHRAPARWFAWEVSHDGEAITLRPADRYAPAVRVRDADAEMVAELVAAAQHLDDTWPLLERALREGARLRREVGVREAQLSTLRRRLDDAHARLDEVSAAD